MQNVVISRIEGGFGSPTAKALLDQGPKWALETLVECPQLLNLNA